MSVLVLDFLPVADFTLVDAEREAALGVRTDPGLEEHRRTLLAVVRKRYQSPVVAFLTLRKVHLPPPFSGRRALPPNTKGKCSGGGGGFFRGGKTGGGRVVFGRGRGRAAAGSPA